jgi:hypothetical protein
MVRALVRLNETAKQFIIHNAISRVDLSQASELELANLSSVCEPASFGVDQKNVLDESYRKARKLDVANFATTFELRKSGIMDVVRAALLEGHNSNRPVEAELYKLNVYGECRPRKKVFLVVCAPA